MDQVVNQEALRTEEANPEFRDNRPQVEAAEGEEREVRVQPEELVAGEPIEVEA